MYKNKKMFIIGVVIFILIQNIGNVSTFASMSNIEKSELDSQDLPDDSEPEQIVDDISEAKDSIGNIEKSELDSQDLFDDSELEQIVNEINKTKKNAKLDIYEYKEEIDKLNEEVLKQNRFMKGKKVKSTVTFINEQQDIDTVMDLIDESEAENVILEIHFDKEDEIYTGYVFCDETDENINDIVSQLEEENDFSLNGVVSFSSDIPLDSIQELSENIEVFIVDISEDKFITNELGIQDEIDDYPDSLAWELFCE